MKKVAMIGAGSTAFAKRLVNDILFLDPFRDAEIRLMDIDPDRLEMSEKTMHVVAERREAQCTIVPTLDRRQALDGADFVICMIQVGGNKATEVDFEVCRRHGLKLVIGDTIGIPAISRALRTAPVMLEFCREMEELCPDAHLLNYTNPMGMNMAAVLRGSAVKGVGLCHGVYGTAHKLAKFLGVEYSRLTYLCAGINHLAFFIRLEVDGKDAYPQLREAFDTTHKDQELVRQEVFRRFGYFMTESSFHLPECVPYFLKSDESIQEYDIAIDEYIYRSQENYEIFEQVAKAFKAGKNVFDGETEGITFTPRSRMRTGHAEPGELGPQFKIADRRSGEYCSSIVNAIATDEPFVFAGNVLNKGLIDNLLPNSCVEVPVLVDANGYQPTHIGSLPPQCAALVQTNINCQELTTCAILEESREHALHAALLSPHASSTLSSKAIVALMDDLLKAHEKLLPKWCIGG